MIIIIEIKESRITNKEYLTYLQDISFFKEKLVKRNLNLLPLLIIETFCHPKRSSFKIRMNNKKTRAIINPSIPLD